MKKTTLVVGYDSEKLNALRLYLKQKDQTLEVEISKAVDSLYTRTVPQGVRDFIEMQATSQSIRPVTRAKNSAAKKEDGCTDKTAEEDMATLTQM
jgi:hypothetical protein